MKPAYLQLEGFQLLTVSNNRMDFFARNTIKRILFHQGLPVLLLTHIVDLKFEKIGLGQKSNATWSPHFGLRKFIYQCSLGIADCQASYPP